jgi:uncharacterized protein
LTVANGTVASGQLANALGPLVVWARSRSDVLALALVGSYARGTAGPHSDVDLVVLVPEPNAFRGDKTWLDQIAWSNRAVISQRDADYGSAWSRHVETDNYEIELTFAGPTWAATNPIDPGTARVISGGCRVLVDKTNLFGNLLTAPSHV